LHLSVLRRAAHPFGEVTTCMPSAATEESSPGYYELGIDLDPPVPASRGLAELALTI
jgi:hypothetical protein